MFRVMVLLVFLCLVISNSFVVQGATISGKVLDPDSQPVANARVFYFLKSFRLGEKETWKETKTAKDGSFKFEKVRLPGEEEQVQIIALAEGFGVGGAELRKDRFVAAPFTGAKPKEFAGIKPAPTYTVSLSKPGFLAGQVVTKKGKPIAGVKVRTQLVNLTSRGPWLSLGEKSPVLFGVTDKSGKFKISGLPDGGTVNLLVIHPGYAQWYQGGIKVGEESIKITLGPESIIKGRVIFEKTGKPGANMKVYAQSYDSPAGTGYTKTDAKGNFILRNLPPSEHYTVCVRFKEDLPEWAARPQIIANVPEGGVVKCPDLKLSKGGFIVGKVADVDTGKPVAGAQIGYYPIFKPPAPSGTYFSVKTKPDGTYRIRASGGKWNVYLMGAPKGYVSGELGRGGRDIEVLPGKTVKGPNFTMERTAKAIVKVIDPEGNPDLKARVYWAEYMMFGMYQRQPDKEGRIALENLKSDSPALICAIDEERELAGEISVVAKKGEEKEFVLKLEKAAKVTGQVTDEEGKPLKSVEVRVETLVTMESGGYVSSTVGSAKTDEKGHFEVKALIPGRQYNVVAAGLKGQGSARSPEFTLGSDETHDVGRLILKRADSFIAGKVTDPDGKPIANVQVSAYPRDGRDWKEARTDAKGRYRIEELVKDKYDLSAWREGYEPDSQREVETGSDKVDFILAPREPAVAPKPRAGIGKPAPEISNIAQWIPPTPKTMKQYRGKMVLLYFSSARNPGAKDYEEKLKALYSKYSGKGLVILGIYDASASVQEVQALLKEKGTPFPVGIVKETKNFGWDSQVFRDYGVKSLPAAFLIDGKGILRSENPTLKELEERIKGLLRK